MIGCLLPVELACFITSKLRVDKLFLQLRKNAFSVASTQNKSTGSSFTWQPFTYFKMLHVSQVFFRNSISSLPNVTHMILDFFVHIPRIAWTLQSHAGLLSLLVFSISCMYISLHGSEYSHCEWLQHTVEKSGFFSTCTPVESDPGILYPEAMQLEFF